MENTLRIINRQQILGKDFRVYGTLENPLFKADDVSEWIEHSNTSMMLKSVEEDEKTLQQIGTLNNAYSAWFLTEDGLYEVLMQSRKPIAKKFKKEVKNVLKQIRITGGYIGIDEQMTDEEIMAKALMVAQKTIEKKNQIIEVQKKQLEYQQPKVIFADAVSASKTSILVGELAKILKQNGISIGGGRLFEWLRNNGYLIKRKGTDWNMPTQKSMELGLFEIKESTHLDSNGVNITTKTPKVAGKGQQYFINKFLQDQAMEEVACAK